VESETTLTPESNWAGNVRFHAVRRHRPISVAELRDIVVAATAVRVLGTGHSFNAIADTTGDLVSVAGLPPEVDVDSDRATVRVAAGLRYGDVAPRLHAAGWALPNLASLPHLSIAGAVATGTHGSGDGNGNLSTAVAGLEVVTADGSLVTPPDVRPWVVGLGALGVATHLTLRLVPTFEIAQYVYDGVPVPSDPAEVDELFGAGYSVSVFTRWAADEGNQAWVKRLPGGTVPPRWLGGTLADGPRHPIPGAPAENCTRQEGIPGPWYERLPHFRPDATPSAGDELQSEYLVPRDRATEALAAMASIGSRVTPVLHVSELRTVAADELWLSPSYRRDSLTIHFTWVNDWAAVAPAMAAVEEVLAPLGARPHWGKLFGYGGFRERYERFDDFVALVRRYDPTGTFRNAWLDQILGP
jgi:xylitol oxidase